MRCWDFNKIWYLAQRLRGLFLVRKTPVLAEVLVRGLWYMASILWFMWSEEVELRVSFRSLDKMFRTLLDTSMSTSVRCIEVLNAV